MRRTYVRRRAAAALLACLLLLGVPAAAHALRDGAGAAPAWVRESRYVVRSGDTLWSIAIRVAPSRDPRTVVDQIDGRNGLADGVIAAGQVLVVPATG